MSWDGTPITVWAKDVEENAVSITIPPGTGTVDVFVMHKEKQISEIAQYTYLEEVTVDPVIISRTEYIHLKKRDQDLDIAEKEITNLNQKLEIATKELQKLNEKNELVEADLIQKQVLKNEINGRNTIIPIYITF